MDINNVRDGIVANAKTISGLNGLPFSPDDADEPLFWVGTGDIEFDKAMNSGQDHITFDCYLAVTKASDKDAHNLVNQYLAGSGSKSLRVALRTDRQLGSSAHDIRLVSARGPIPIDLGANRYLGAQLTVWVTGRGDA